jgi:hypothetical protein
MTLDIKLTAAHDLDLDAGAGILVDGRARVAQGIRIALKLWLGEYFLDTTAGVPYLTSILIKQPNRATIEAILRRTIRSVNGVTSVDSLDINIDRQARTLSVTFTASSGDDVISDTVLLSE